MLKFVYSFFLGILLAVFVGMGVATFYAAPKYPEYPKALSSAQGDPSKYTPDQKQLDETYQKQNEAYSKRSQDYNRNVAMIVLGVAVVLMALGLALETRAGVLADGLLLGGTFTLIYSIGRSFAGQDPKYSFAVVSVGLLATVVVGYFKFIKPSAPAHARAKK
jgi:hypothetical protein